MENTRQYKPVADILSSQRLWKILFFSILIGYCLFYAPFGINETDGGFLTGLAWQVLNGKTLYEEIVYVRPPLPVWLRAGELLMLPENFAVLGERWIFYLKVGLYSWLGAAVLAADARRWMLAVFGFVVSAHCYPPMAWHTVDGILFAALGIWCWVKLPSRFGAALAGVAIFAALLCKQSFYPMVGVFAVLLFFEKNRTRTWWGASSLLICSALFFSYLHSNNLLESYLQMTGGSTSGGQALQHGIFDYFRIKPGLVLLSLPILAPVAWYFWKNKKSRAAYWGWDFWLSLLATSYALSILGREEFTVPFSQARLLFWVGVVYALHNLFSVQHSTFNIHHSSLLAVAWCSSISWGYNVPILFSTPFVFAVMEISRHLWRQAYPEHDNRWHSLAVLAGLLILFRLSNEYIYRDGPRSEMSVRLGKIFPQLGGVCSDSTTAVLYFDLKNLADRYPNFKTLPAFSQANFLTKTPPPLPLDWVVRREINDDNTLILKTLQENRPMLFIEKSWLTQIETDPEMDLTRELIRTGKKIDETQYFWVVDARGH